ncbi:MAG: hypothetical protein HUJ27_08410 [Rhodobacteraceae bacterium]|nr:hypothetical protein [Paracoccaceae bacterium]
MRIAFHLGAHATDDGNAIRSLLKNTDLLLSRDVIVPRPVQFRERMGAMMRQHRVSPASLNAQREFLASLTRRTHLSGVVFSSPAFLCAAPRIFADTAFYGRAGLRAKWLRNIFPQAECEFFLAVRNPVTFLPGVLRTQPGLTAAGLMGGARPDNMHWSRVVSDIRNAVPDCPLTVWCDEERPVLWPRILRALAEIEEETPIDGALDEIEPLLDAAAFGQLTQDLADAPRDTDALVTFLAHYLEEHAHEDALDQAVDLPGLTSDALERLDDQYEADLARIEAMPGVKFLGV